MITIVSSESIKRFAHSIQTWNSQHNFRNARSWLLPSPAKVGCGRQVVIAETDVIQYNDKLEIILIGNVSITSRKEYCHEKKCILSHAFGICCIICFCPQFQFLSNNPLILNTFLKPIFR